MKKLFARLAVVMATGFIAASVAPHAAAQTVPDMRVDIPFEFQVAGETLAAGSYYVTVGDVHQRLNLRSVEGRSIFLAGYPSNRIPGERSSLVFNKYGDTYFLRQVLSSRRPVGVEVPVSKAEKALINVAGIRPVVETVAAGSR